MGTCSILINAILYRDFIHGVNSILRYIARAASFSNFYGQDTIQAAHVCFGFTYGVYH
jgi:hypothetical protein